MSKRKKPRAKALTGDREARGKRFRDARLAIEMEAVDVAAAIGTTQTTVWRWEQKGTIPAGDLLDKAAKLYRRSPGWLLTGEEGAPDGNAPEPAALRDFLAGNWPETPLLEKWMIDQMRAARFPDEREPTVETYRRMVLSYVTATPKQPGAGGSDS